MKRYRMKWLVIEIGTLGKEVQEGLLAVDVHKSIDQIKARHRTIKQSYTKCTDNNKRTGPARKTTKYFKDAEELFSGKDVINAPFVVDIDQENPVMNIEPRSDQNIVKA
ncbi:unnamed protein product [Didymodactylos carnosus]|uniref:Uncharacterized protein n=1 Tax=Didymodactylos carnosus TaxID=1234261 RepID=A0A8S2FSI6_9BILA|nr:unnamed protein product [Didymodactylos carnosus]CAF4323063.1 unnamed protein product [Didymodactylos carnosus]